jgi:hypothetical protein
MPICSGAELASNLSSVQAFPAFFSDLVYIYHGVTVTFCYNMQALVDDIEKLRQHLSIGSIF